MLTLLGAGLSTPVVALEPAPGAVLTEQRVLLGPGQRVAGMPASPEPGRQLAAATVVVQVDDDKSRDWVRATVDLVAEPPLGSAEEAVLMVGYGHLSGNSCRLSGTQLEMTSPDARQYTLLDWFGEEGYSQVGPLPATPFECVAVALQSRDASATYDAFVGALENSYVAPRLEVGAVSQLGAPQKRLRLVPGEWMPYSVTVRNIGEQAVQTLSVAGRGKGLKVRGSTHGSALAAGEETTLDVWVRLGRGTRRSSVTLTVDAGQGVRAEDRIKARRAAPPAPPVDGGYRDRSGRVRFQVRNGRVTGFRASATTRCGSYLNPSQTTNTYDFPTTRIPRSGVVVATDKGTGGEGEYTVHLSLRATGSKVTRGHFSYYFYMPGVLGSNCSAVVPFSAKRVGR